MQRPILNLADAPVIGDASGEHFAYSMSRLAAGLGAQSIGSNVTRVPPGKAAFPLHHHRAIEEHFLILAGTGVLRLGSQVYDVRVNDYIVNCAGDASTAHQLINTGDEDLVYLAISTRVLPDVVGYPDSGKTGVAVAGGNGEISRFLVEDADRNTVGYWDNEDGSAVEAVVASHRR